MHVPTTEQRAKVEALAVNGITQEKIAAYIGIDSDTLRKHYDRELNHAVSDKIAALGGNLYQDALNGDKQAREFWLKTRGRWSYAKAEEDVKRDERMTTLLEALLLKK